MEPDFKAIEAKWQVRWAETDAFAVNVRSDGASRTYCLVMFSYPSGDRLHMGHWFNYAPIDTWARFRRMQGENVFQPMGFDSFGLPAENFAIKHGVHPRIHTENNIRKMRAQLAQIGAMYDPATEIHTHDPGYFKWTQWLFLKFFEHGLAFRRGGPVNWCDSCQTVLANEQVTEGTCERCDNPVRRRHLDQWYLNITRFADALLEDLDGLSWPEKSVKTQKNWIGRRQGATIRFPVAGGTLEVFTTRPETVYGASYVVLAPEHPLTEELTTEAELENVQAYLDQAAHLSEIERSSTEREKTGVFTGSYARHPLTDEELPIYVADYVLPEYGTGAIMAVPAHDQRDMEFATKFGLPVRSVIEAERAEDASPDEAYEGDGVLVNSAEFSGMRSERLRAEIPRFFAEQDCGEATTTYRLRDWLVSRQRYWGAPIPIVHCPGCGVVPVPEIELPVLLPEDVEFTPTGESPLRRHPTWRHCACPTCGEPAERETDTLDTFVDSSWYYLRYLSPDDDENPFDTELAAKWMPVTLYVGGPEHATMHLLYARFVCRFLHQLGLVPVKEPFPRLAHQGIITSQGARMSKSRGNVVNPDELLEKHGSDVLRGFLLFGFNFEIGGDWRSDGIQAVDRYLRRVYRLAADWAPAVKGRTSELPRTGDLAGVVHQAIQRMSTLIETLRFHGAYAVHMELTRDLSNNLSGTSGPLQPDQVGALRTWLLLLAPLAPHLASELWEHCGFGEDPFAEQWPAFDPAAVEQDHVRLIVQVDGKKRGEIEVPKTADDEELREAALGLGPVRAAIGDAPVRRVIAVPNRLVNLVTGS